MGHPRTAELGAVADDPLATLAQDAELLNLDRCVGKLRILAQFAAKQFDQPVEALVGGADRGVVARCEEAKRRTRPAGGVVGSHGAVVDDLSAPGLPFALLYRVDDIARPDIGIGQHAQHGRNRVVVVREVLLPGSRPVSRIEVGFGADSKPPPADLLASELVNERLNKLPDVAGPDAKIAGRLGVAVAVLGGIVAHCRRDIVQHDPGREAALANARERGDRSGEIADRLALVLDAPEVVVLFQFDPAQQPHAVDVIGVPIRAAQFLVLRLVQERRLDRDRKNVPEVVEFSQLGVGVNDYVDRLALRGGLRLSKPIARGNHGGSNKTSGHQLYAAPDG